MGWAFSLFFIRILTGWPDLVACIVRPSGLNSLVPGGSGGLVVPGVRGPGPEERAGGLVFVCDGSRWLNVCRCVSLGLGRCALLCVVPVAPGIISPPGI